MKNWLFLIIALWCVKCTPNPVDDADKKLKILILSGRNNHEWQSTTALLVKMYARQGDFDVSVTELPDTLTFETLKPFDAVVSNWSAWPDHSFRWPAAAEKGLMDFIEAGGGFVVIHAASATFYDWPEYQQMVGTTWGDSTGHSAASPHKIVIKDNTHPVTRGMTDFWITDELWVNAGINAELHILAESFSDTTNAGRVVMEPVMHWKEVGKGRVFHSILGHDDRAMKNTAWQTLLLRGTEWAATANVTIALPPDLQTNEQVEKNRYSWLASDSSIALLNQGEIMWQYNYLTVKGKPYFHPVRINNSTLTWLSPEDHPWHLGIWHSWKYINDVNYWEYDLSEGVEPFNYLGITEVRDIQIEKGSDFSCVMHLQIAYHEKNGPDLMLDNRKIMVSPPDSAGLYFIDFQLDISALADSVELNRTPLAHEPNGQSWGGYGGLSIRFHPDLFDPQFINPDGSTDMKHGEPQAWKFFGLRNIFGDNIGIAVFTESGNLSHPEPWFMSASNDHPFYFFGPSPLFYNPYTLESGDRLQLGYRMQFYVGDTDKDLLARDYQTFLNK